LHNYEDKRQWNFCRTCEQYWTLITLKNNIEHSLREVTINYQLVICKYGNNKDSFIKQNWSYNEQKLMSQCMNINYGEHPWIGWQIVLKRTLEGPLDIENMQWVRQRDLIVITNFWFSLVMDAWRRLVVEIG